MSTPLVLRLVRSDRRYHLPVLVALSLAAAMTFVLGGWTSALGDLPEGDPTTLMVIGALALGTALLVVDTMTRHAAAERWPSIRVLRALGLSGWGLARLLVLEALVVGLAAVVAGFLLAVPLARLAGQPFHQLGVLPSPGPTPGWGAWVGVVTGTVIATGILGNLRASASLTRAEPGLPLGAGARPRRRVGWVRGLLTALAAATTAVLAGASLSTTDSQVAFLTGFGALLTAVTTLGLAWGWMLRLGWLCLQAVPRLPLPTRTAVGWARDLPRATTAVACLLGLGLFTYLSQFPVGTAHAAQERISAALAGRLVADEPPSTAGLHLHHVEIEVTAPGSRPAPSMGATGTTWDTLLGTDLGAEATGVIVTVEEADYLGVSSGDQLRISIDGRSTELAEVLEVVRWPEVFGSTLLVAPESVESIGSPGLWFLDPDRGAAAGVPTTTARRWVEGLEPGRAVSATGGRGTQETVLLLGAPLPLTLALATSSAVVTTVRRVPDLDRLRRIGAPLSTRLVTATSFGLLLALPPALVGTLIGQALVSGPVSAYAQAVGSAASSAPIPFWSLVWTAVFVLVTTAGVLLTSLRSGGRWGVGLA